MIDKIIELRKTLHANPELSGRESGTTRIIERFLVDHNISLVKKISTGGLLAGLEFQNPGPKILFRAELDALPIDESTNIVHRSKNAGISHKCGHDGHMAILCGLALKLLGSPLEKGSVYFLFQPAEETGEGARITLKDPEIRSFNPDYIFALHNLPGYEKGKVFLRNNTFTASVTSIIIHLSGRTSHAAEPEKGINPTLAVADIIHYMSNLENRDTNHVEFLLTSPTFIQIGMEGHGINAGHAKLHFTLRAWDNQFLNSICLKIEEEIREISLKHSLGADISYTESFPAVVNDPSSVEILKQAANLAGLTLEFMEKPFRWGEDFGTFTSLWRGAICGLGAGIDHPPLHSPEYDFPDEIIKDGIDLFYAATKTILR